MPIRDNVSVVIPAYNSERTIERAIESTLSQSLPPKEIVVIDDGSRTPIAKRLTQYGDRLRVIRQVNRGAAAARNRGIMEARADWIAFLDADDEWLPRRLEVQAEAISRYPQIGFCFGAVYRRSGGEQDIMKPQGMAERLLALSPIEAFQTSYRIQTSVVLARREALLKSPFDASLRTAEDRDVWIRLLLRTYGYCIADPIAIHYEYSGSLSNSDHDCDARNMLEVISRYRPLLGEEEARIREADVYRRWAGVLVSAGRSTSALAPAWQYLKRAPKSPGAWYVAGRTLAGVAAEPGKQVYARMRSL